MSQLAVVQIIIVGLNNAGKTTILYKLWVQSHVSQSRSHLRPFLTSRTVNSHLGEVVVTQPTIGSNVEEINYNNVKFQVWDLGGQVRSACLMQHLWL